MLVKELIRLNSLSELNLVRRPRILDFLDDKLKHLKKFKHDEYPNFLFYGKSKTVIYMKQNLENEIFFIDYIEIWSVLKSKYKLNYTEIQTLTSWYIENTYNLKGVHTVNEVARVPTNIENTYNLKGVHTSCSYVGYLNCIENVYNLKGADTTLDKSFL